MKPWCPHKCINMKSSGERSEVTDPPHTHTHTLYKLFCTQVFQTHGGWSESCSAYFSWGRITLHLHCPLMLLTSPRASPNSLSWAFPIFIFIYFLPKLKLHSAWKGRFHVTAMKCDMANHADMIWRTCHQTVSPRFTLALFDVKHHTVIW